MDGTITPRSLLENGATQFFTVRTNPIIESAVGGQVAGGDPLVELP